MFWFITLEFIHSSSVAQQHLCYTFAKTATDNYDLAADEEEEYDELLTEIQYLLKRSVNQISQIKKYNLTHIL